MSEIDVTKCTRYCADNGKCTAFKGMYLCSERANCYTKRIIKKQMIIDKLNNQLQRYKQVIEDIKEIAENNIDDKQIIAVQTMLNGNPDIKNEVLKQIIQKCEEVND